MKKVVFYHFMISMIIIEIIFAVYWLLFILCFALYIGSTEPSQGAILEFGVSFLKNHPILACITIIDSFVPSLYREYKREQKEKANNAHNLV